MAVTEDARTGRPSRPRSALTWDRATPFLMIAPSVLLIAGFVYGFIAYTGFTSLTKWNSIVPDFSFVGLHQYAILFSEDRFHLDLRNTVIFTVVFLVFSVLLGFSAAVLLDQRMRGSQIFQTIYLFPLALSFVVTGVVWRWLWSPSQGIDVALRALHIDPAHAPLGIMTDPRTALASLVVAAVWQESGFCMAMFLAGLRGIPEELKEAAHVDGASGWQTFWRVIVPQLNPILLSAIIILGHISLKIFDLVFVMTNGGPGNATDMPGLYMYSAIFNQSLYAKGAAIAIVLLLMVCVLVVPYLVWNLRQENQES